jgi:[ribosomal protein S5]-alanine N-acetyltransferase
MAKALMSFVRQKGVRDFCCTVAIENIALGRVMQKCGLHMDHESNFKKRGTDIVYPSHIYKLHLEQKDG